MNKKILALVVVVVLIISLMAIEPASAQNSAEQYFASMSTEEKISQMIMPAFRSIGGKKVTEITEDIASSIEKHGYAGVILFGENTPTNENTVRLVDAIQKSNAKGKSGRPQLLISVDQEGGFVTRLGQGTMMPGNMALGAINDPDMTKEVASIMGRELSALGFNADFAPVVDVNNNPANPVIGVRSFSDNPSMVADHGKAFMRALNNVGVISTLKHFPGHGDTGKDSHSDLPCVNKSYDQLKENELVPFKDCIDAGSQMIMTAHIEYPQIEKETYKSISTGEDIYLPATLSKTIISDILRKDMGFRGVVATDALNMGAISKHFDKYDVAKLAIEAGVDILLMPINMSAEGGIAEMDNYITTLAEKVRGGEISMDKIDAAVKRILELKERNGLFNAYNGSDVEDRVRYAVDHVGTKENHDREWEIAEKAVTLVKNDDNTLPLIKSDQKTVVLVPYDEDMTPMNYAVRKLKEDGKLPGSVKIEVHSYYKKAIEEVMPMIGGANNVVFLSEMFGVSDLGGDTAKMADLIADEIHRTGGKFVVMSAQLPYDTARYQKADAIMLSYLAESMSVDPEGKVREIQKYGPNMPAALYVMFSKDDAPTARLPIDIPQLDDSYNFTDKTLYSRGFGLTYELDKKDDVG